MLQLLIYHFGQNGILKNTGITFESDALTGFPFLNDTGQNAYGGAVGYFGFDGNLDSAIAIRTVFMDGNKSYVQAGAGIVADSDPQTEFEETENKARGMVKAIALARTYSQAEETEVDA